jgi:serine/threonine protein kinase
MLKVSSIVDHYRLLEEIGRGGFSVVYRAEDIRLGRHVALKVLREEDYLPVPQQERQRKRFWREATIAAQLAHPNIVTIYELGEWEGVQYIAMELLLGETLCAHLERKRRLSLAEALPIAEQVCAALEHAHRHHLVHRDVKPDNIFLLPDGRVKLTDFGIARPIDAVSVTQAGSYVGSPAYMAPEQIAGAKPDHRADIFSLGVTLYEALSGRRPFESRTIPMAFHNILHSPPAPLPELPPRVQAVLYRALEKEVRRRYGSAQAFLAAFRAAVADAEKSPRVSRRRSVSPSPPGSGGEAPSVSGEPPVGTGEAVTWKGRLRSVSEAFEFDALLGGAAAPKEAAVEPDTGEAPSNRTSMEWKQAEEAEVSPPPPPSAPGAAAEATVEAPPPVLYPNVFYVHPKRSRWRGFGFSPGETFGRLALLGGTVLAAGLFGMGVGAYAEMFLDYRLFYRKFILRAGWDNFFPFGPYPTLLYGLALALLAGGAVWAFRHLGQRLFPPGEETGRRSFFSAACVLAVAAVMAGGCGGMSWVSLDRQVFAYNSLLQRAREAEKRAQAAFKSSLRYRGTPQEEEMKRSWQAYVDEKVQALEEALALHQPLRLDPRLPRRYRSGERCLPDAQIPPSLRQAGAKRLVFLLPR